MWCHGARLLRGRCSGLLVLVLLVLVLLVPLLWVPLRDDDAATALDVDAGRNFGRRQLLVRRLACCRCGSRIVRASTLCF